MTNWQSGWLLGLVLLAGCGRGAYEERLKTALVEVDYQARFAGLDLKPEPIGRHPIEVRIPAAFTAAPLNAGIKSMRITPETRNPSNPNEVLAPTYLNPPFAQLPGAVLCIQYLVPPQGNNSTPIGVYLGAVPADNDKTWADTIRDQLRQSLPDVKDIEWKSETIDTTDKKKQAYQVIRASGDGGFWQFGYVEPRPMPLVVDICVVEKDGWRIFLALAGSKQAQGTFDPDKLCPLMVGTLKVKAPPAQTN